MRAELPRPAAPGRSPAPSAPEDRPGRDFGRYLRLCREKVGLASQRAAVRSLGKKGLSVSQGVIAHYESGRVRDPDPAILAELAALYGVDFLEMQLRLAQSRFGATPAAADPRARARWELIASSLTPVGPVEDAGGLELDQLRARAALLREVQVLDVEGIANWQRSIESLESFWVVAPYFLDDEEKGLLDAVVANLKRGVRYSYFLYPDAGARFDALVRELRARVGGARVRDLARAVWLPREALTWLHADYVVANPTRRASAVGFQNLRQRGKTRFALRLPEPDLLGLVDRLTAWIAATPKRR